jgi:hypothetical protein
MAIRLNAPVSISLCVSFFWFFLVCFDAVSVFCIYVKLRQPFPPCNGHEPQSKNRISQKAQENCTHSDTIMALSLSGENPVEKGSICAPFVCGENRVRREKKNIARPTFSEKFSTVSLTRT